MLAVMGQHDRPGDTGVEGNLSIAGKLSYVQIPATDVEKTATFYADVFGWTLRGGGSRHRSFTDTSGALIGAFVLDRAISREPGILPYIYVESIDGALEQIAAHGGEVVTAPYAEGPLWVARFRDPSGNAIGVWTAASR